MSAYLEGVQQQRLSTTSPKHINFYVRDKKDRGTIYCQNISTREYFNFEISSIISTIFLQNHSNQFGFHWRRSQMWNDFYAIFWSHVIYQRKMWNGWKSKRYQQAPNFIPIAMCIPGQTGPFMKNTKYMLEVLKSTSRIRP